MQDVINDIQTLELAIDAFTAGASDERRMALNAMKDLLDEKQQILDTFEELECEEEFLIDEY